MYRIMMHSRLPLVLSSYKASSIPCCQKYVRKYLKVLEEKARNGWHSGSKVDKCTSTGKSS